MKTWVKLVSIVAVVLLGVVVAAGFVLAQGPEDGSGPPIGPQDEDGDGVCDVCGIEVEDGSARGWRFSQEGDAPQFGTGRSVEREFIDENGDGICDGFVDQDGDGVCDECGMTIADGQGSMRGGRMGNRMGGRSGGRYNTP
ncbi:MAG: hypothetical protein ISS56_14830 [Anaerolineae bacterium]|nr:hypothetical protein [Anaerolineae bacterium]